MTELERVREARAAVRRAQWRWLVLWIVVGVAVVVADHLAR